MTTFPTTARLARLLRRFSPSLIRLGVDGPRPLPGGGSGPPLVLVGRELCLFLHVDASAVPPKQRPGFVALEVRRAAPFADPEHDLAWFGDHAAVWYWSRERVHGLLGEPAARARTRAEATYRGTAAQDDAVELLALESGDADAGDGNVPPRAGIEARLWRQGHLAASRWWPDAPSASDWQAFLRGGGLDPGRPQPVPQSAGLRERPLGGGLQQRPLAGALREQWPLLATCAGALVLAVLAWQLAGIWRVVGEIGDVQARITPLETQLQSIIDARARADAAAMSIETLLALRQPASQTRLLGEIQRITPGTGWQLMQWQQPGPETLEVTLKGGGLDTAAIVAAWEQSPLLQEVSPATGSGLDELTLRARLTPLREQTP